MTGVEQRVTCPHCGADTFHTLGGTTKYCPCGKTSYEAPKGLVPATDVSPALHEQWMAGLKEIAELTEENERLRTRLAQVRAALSDSDRKHSTLQDTFLNLELTQCRSQLAEAKSQSQIDCGEWTRLVQERELLKQQLAEQKSPWIACSKQMPEMIVGRPNYHVMVWWHDRVAINKWDEMHGVSHWMPIPPLPAPVEDAAEKAFSDWFHEKHGGHSNPMFRKVALDAWQAALSSQGKEKA